MAINLSYSTEQRKYQGSANEALLYGVNQLEERALKNQTKVDAFQDYLNNTRASLDSSYINDFDNKANKYKSTISNFLEKGDLADAGDLLFNLTKEIKGDTQTNNQLISSANASMYSEMLAKDDKVDQVFKDSFFIPGGLKDRLMQQGIDKPLTIDDFMVAGVPQKIDIRQKGLDYLSMLVPDINTVDISESSFLTEEDKKLIGNLGLGDAANYLNKNIKRTTDKKVAYIGLEKELINYLSDESTPEGQYVAKLVKAHNDIALAEGRQPNANKADIIKSYMAGITDEKGDRILVEKMTDTRLANTESWLSVAESMAKARQKALQDAQQSAIYTNDGTSVFTDIPIATPQNEKEAYIQKTQHLGKISDLTLAAINNGRITEDVANLVIKTSQLTDPNIIKENIAQLYAAKAPPSILNALNTLVSATELNRDLSNKAFGAGYMNGMDKVVSNNGLTRKDLIGVLESDMAPILGVSNLSDDSNYDLDKEQSKFLKSFTNYLSRLKYQNGTIKQALSYVPGEISKELLSNPTAYNKFVDTFGNVLQENINNGLSQSEIDTYLDGKSELSDLYAENALQRKEEKVIAVPYVSEEQNKKARKLIADRIALKGDSEANELKGPNGKPLEIKESLIYDVNNKSITIPKGKDDSDINYLGVSQRGGEMFYTFTLKDMKGGNQDKVYYTPTNAEQGLLANIDFKTLDPATNQEKNYLTWAFDNWANDKRYTYDGVDLGQMLDPKLDGAYFKLVPRPDGTVDYKLTFFDPKHIKSPLDVPANTIDDIVTQVMKLKNSEQ